MATRWQHRTLSRWLLFAAVFLLLAGACTGATPSPTTGGGGGSASTGLPATTGRSGTTAGGPATTARPTVPVPTYVDGNGFNDHSVPSIGSVEEFFALARAGVSGQSAVKFSIANMTFDPQLSWMDSNFYSLHDEWYWFRLLNGAAVSGSAEVPLAGLRFETVAEIYDWARSLGAGALPLDLSWIGSQSVGTRLYSDDFYDLALNVNPRVLGLGSLVYFPDSPDGGGERWVIELEYHDDVLPDEVAQFFRLVAATVPVEVGDNLEWVVRSSDQERAAQIMAAGALPFHDRVVRYSQLVAPGQVAVYNEGVAAGRLLLIGDGGKDLSDARDNDILLIENVPDWLPPGRALISSAPQTPLAHVNLLARNRGIPNASQAGIIQDAGIRQAARVRAPAIVRAVAPDRLEVVIISEEQYSQWQKLNTVTPISVPQADVSSMPNVVNLASVTQISSDDDVAAWLPVIGGKAAGFINLMGPNNVSLPPDPLAITVAPYRQHLTKIERALDAMLGNQSFTSQTRIRYLLLEGPAAYANFYAQQSDRAFAEEFAAANPPGTPIGDIISAGGFVEYLRSVPMDAATLADITATLGVTYGEYALSQGLRFRSSSTVEDIEGFNGAGLYDSNTGFLRPDVQIDGGDQKKTVEWALKNTWSSYWGFEAFEERRRERVDHRSGAMAVLVHARFDDPLERSNGVFTFTILPDSAADQFVMILNAQEGDVSVANPDPTLGAVPEAVVVRRQSSNAGWRVERVEQSNLAPAGVQVLDDEQLGQIFSEAQAVTLLWRDRINAGLPAAQRIETLTLDFEVKEMAAGWPALKGGLAARPARIVIKQARSLEPGLREVPDSVRRLAIPRDVLARARLVERVSCPLTDGSSAVAVTVLTDPLIGPDVGYSIEPFVLGEVGAIPADQSSCTAEILYSTPQQYLIELLATGVLLNLSQ